jgi:hypothetical protein
MIDRGALYLYGQRKFTFRAIPMVSSRHYELRLDIELDARCSSRKTEAIFTAKSRLAQVMAVGVDSEQDS